VHVCLGSLQPGGGPIQLPLDTVCEDGSERGRHAGAGEGAAAAGAAAPVCCRRRPMMEEKTRVRGLSMYKGAPSAAFAASYDSMPAAAWAACGAGTGARESPRSMSAQHIW